MVKENMSVNASEAREKAQRLLELAEKVSSNDWVAKGRHDYSITGRKGTMQFAIPFDFNDARFIAAARNDVPALAKWVLEAVGVLEKIAYHQYDDWRLMQWWARQFLKGDGETTEDQTTKSAEI